MEQPRKLNANAIAANSQDPRPKAPRKAANIFAAFLITASSLAGYGHTEAQKRITVSQLASALAASKDPPSNSESAVEATSKKGTLTGEERLFIDERRGKTFSFARADEEPDEHQARK